jgi:lysine 2,3-aminomutase
MTGLHRTLTTVDGLVAASLAGADTHYRLQRVADRYVIAVTPEVRSLIDATDPDDPIAKQFVPNARELISTPSERADPIGDDAHSPVTGIVHRYDDRVLLKIASVCPVYCRFCFRREMVGPDSGRNLSDNDLDNALAYIAASPRIREVILTGGDPMVLSARRLRDVAERLNLIPHVETLRVHTRVPVASPEFVNDARLAALQNFRREVRVAVHVNHPRELSDAARGAIARLQAGGIEMISQTVLLRDINDNAKTLADLFAAFHAARIRPYYLHHADLAPGTSHFRVALTDGLKLMIDVRALMPNSPLPKYVLDIPGGFGKVSVAENVRVIAPGVYEVRDRYGRLHRYADDLGCRAIETAA